MELKKLPEEFLRRMRELLGSEEEYSAFLRSYEMPASRGIRLNLQKLLHLRESEHMQSYERLVAEWGLEPLPEAGTLETADGKRYYREFYVNEERMQALGIRPGKHPYHEAGLYYMQEPSAMQVVPGLEIRPFDRVIDLCASPGGKSTQAADCLDYSRGGLLISNEYVGNRARTLSSNIERMGVPCAAVLNEDTGRLAERFPGYFSRVIVDAPCSGEGMFRKDETAVAEWSPENVALCAARQKEILDNALVMLAPGGRLSYSTCTFERAEDEDIRDYILAKAPDLRLVHEKRIFPHRERGEGHYVAVFERPGEDLTAAAEDISLKEEKNGDTVYLVPDSMPDLRGLRVLRKGVAASELLKKRENPHHALAHALRLRQLPEDPEDSLAAASPVIDLPAEDPRIGQYLHGLEFAISPEEAGEIRGGFVIVACDGAALGYGKYVNGRIKNHFPKGLRFV